MTADRASHVEPSAEATPEASRRFLTLAALFLSGPTIWITHFFVVYLPAEALCQARIDTRVLGLPVVSTVTLSATALAVAATAAPTIWAYRRWRNSGAGWDGQEPQPPHRAGEPDAALALAGFLQGLLFIVAILFVGLPALVLAC